MRSYPGQLVDAIIYGRDLRPEGEDSVTQERFDKIRYYLKHSKYPRGADRAEKSRLRSAATHYKLIGGENGDPERLMLKDKEVVSDPQLQYDIARQIHAQQHGGINKTTATIAVKYHWVRIKETVSRVIRDCAQCKETAKAPIVNGIKAEEQPNGKSHHGLDITSSNEVVTSTDRLMTDAPDSHPYVPGHSPAVPAPDDCITDYAHMPLDPQIIDINPHLSRFHHHQSMADPYDHQHHELSHVPFEEELRSQAPSDYHAIVNDESDSEALRRDPLGLVNTQLGESQQEQEILSRYVDRSDDELEFN